MKTFFSFLLPLVLLTTVAGAQDPSALMKQIRDRMEKISDYEAGRPV